MVRQAHHERIYTYFPFILSLSKDLGCAAFMVRRGSPRTVGNANYQWEALGVFSDGFLGVTVLELGQSQVAP